MTRNDAHHEHLTQLFRELGAFGLGIVPAKMPSTPEPDDIDHIREDLVLLARKVDAIVAAYGDYLNANTSNRVDLSLFKDQLAGALEGNALYEISEAAEDLKMQEQDADDRLDAWRDSKMISHQWESER